MTYHEIPNGPVEECSIVVAFFTQTDEILSSFGHLENIIYTVVYIQTFLRSQNAAFVDENALNEHRNCSQTSSFPLYITGSRHVSEVGFQLTGETVRKHDTTFTQMKVVTSLQPCLTYWERHYKVCSTAAGGTSEASVSKMETNKQKWRVRVSAPRIATCCTVEVALGMTDAWSDPLFAGGGVALMQRRWGLLLTSAVLRSAASFTLCVCMCVRNEPFSFSNNRRRFPRINTGFRNKCINWYSSYSAAGSHRDGALPLFPSSVFRLLVWIQCFISFSPWL